MVWFGEIPWYYRPVTYNVVKFTKPHILKSGDYVVFLTPYSTTLGSKYRLESIFSGIRRAEINEELAVIPSSEIGTIIKLVSPRSKDFQPFTQPILDKDFSDMYASVVL